MRIRVRSAETCEHPRTRRNLPIQGEFPTDHIPPPPVVIPAESRGAKDPQKDDETWAHDN